MTGHVPVSSGAPSFNIFNRFYFSLSFKVNIIITSSSDEEERFQQLSPKRVDNQRTINIIGDRLARSLRLGRLADVNGLNPLKSTLKLKKQNMKSTISSSRRVNKQTKDHNFSSVLHYVRSLEFNARLASHPLSSGFDFSETEGKLRERQQQTHRLDSIRKWKVSRLGGKLAAKQASIIFFNFLV